MVDFFEKIPNGTPKLPDNYWEGDEVVRQEEINIFDKNLKAAVEDISIFNKKYK